MAIVLGWKEANICILPRGNVLVFSSGLEYRLSQSRHAAWDADSDSGGAVGGLADRWFDKILP